MFDLNKKEKPFTSFGGFGGGGLGLGLSGGVTKQSTYVDDVFSTYVYKGTSGSNPINNGIDLAGEGGMVWIRPRNYDAGVSPIHDTERGAMGQRLSSDSPNQQVAYNPFASVNNNGFTVSGSGTAYNNSSYDYASWTFRKAPGFFDVVTYPGDSDPNRTISHNLGSTPGMIIVKGLQANRDWVVHHRSVGFTEYLRLNEPGDPLSIGTRISAANASTFTPGSDSDTNQTGKTYVAYIFAHDDAQFGTDGDESIIKCGQFEAVPGTAVNLGFEPQFLLLKTIDSSRGWFLIDNMRGIGMAGDTNSNSEYLFADTTAKEDDNRSIFATPTGFEVATTTSFANNTHIYMAIRRPNKPPTISTDVFAIDTSDATSPSPPQFTSGFVTDFIIRKTFNGANNQFGSRLTGTNYMSSYATTAESSASLLTWDFMDGWSNSSGVDTNLGCYMFKRAPGFMDVVTYMGTGTNSAGTQQVVNHNLEVSPELVIVKNRDSSRSFFVWSSYTTENTRMRLDDTAQSFGGGGQYWQSNSTFTATQFGLGFGVNTNRNNDNHVAYLFASLAGISKIGTYSGNTGSNVNVDCGFVAGARFVLIKRTDAEVTGTYSSGWYVWDTLRGIGSGNDPYWLTNSTNNPVTNTNYVNPLSTGFTVNAAAPAALNVTGGTYLFLAIA